MYILLKSSITQEELDDADEMLHTFVFRTQELYGLKEMTPNMHSLVSIFKDLPYRIRSFVYTWKCRKKLILVHYAIRCYKYTVTKSVSFPVYWSSEAIGDPKSGNYGVIFKNAKNIPF